MKDWQNKINENLVKNVWTPPAKENVPVNIIVSQVGPLHEAWLKIGDKLHLLATGSLQEVNEKAMRTRRFVADSRHFVGMGMDDAITAAKNC